MGRKNKQKNNKNKRIQFAPAVSHEWEHLCGRMMGKKQYRMAMAQADLMKKDGFSDDQIRAFLHSVDTAIFDPKNVENDSEFGNKESA